MTNKITKKEPWGPLRSGLLKLSEELPADAGGEIYKDALDLANAILDLVLDLEENHGLGNSDVSIPETYPIFKVGRKKGIYSVDY